MQTPVRDLLGCEIPIVAFSHCRDVVAAVSKAGGFGVLGVTGLTPDQLEIELRWIEEQIGDLPYGVDILVPAKFVGKDEGGHDESALEALVPEEHRRFLDALLEEHGVPRMSQEEERHTATFEAEGQRELIEVGQIPERGERRDALHQAHRLIEHRGAQRVHLLRRRLLRLTRQSG